MHGWNQAEEEHLSRAFLRRCWLLFGNETGVILMPELYVMLASSTICTNGFIGTVCVGLSPISYNYGPISQR